MSQFCIFNWCRVVHIYLGYGICADLGD